MTKNLQMSANTKLKRLVKSTNWKWESLKMEIIKYELGYQLMLKKNIVDSPTKFYELHFIALWVGFWQLWRFWRCWLRRI